MHKCYKVIIIPGLGDHIGNMIWATKHWAKYGFQPVVHKMNWRDGNDFQSKLNLLLEKIDQHIKEGSKVSLIGCSAGGSAALNAFCERKATITKVVNICGRLRQGTHKGFRSVESRTVTSPAFAQSVKLFEQLESKLSNKDREKIMTVRALFGDELVPSDTTTLEGAHNMAIPTPEHMFSIFMALTLFSKSTLEFLKAN